MVAAVAEVEAAWERLAAVAVDGMGVPQVLEALERLEAHRRRQPAVEHALIGRLQSLGSAREMGAKSWPVVLAHRLGILLSTTPHPTGLRTAGPRRAAQAERC